MTAIHLLIIDSVKLLLLVVVVIVSIAMAAFGIDMVKIFCILFSRQYKSSKHAHNQSKGDMTVLSL